MIAPRDNLLDPPPAVDRPALVDRSWLVDRKMQAIAASLGQDVRRERERRRLSTRDVADAAGVSQSVVSGVEAGRVAGLETYARLALALRLQPEFALVDSRRRGQARAEDPVHAAMGEIVAARLASLGMTVCLDEPYQHFQFAGRGDVVAWDPSAAALTHVENRTRFPNIQEAMGSFGSKKAYLADDLAARLGVRGWRSETHVLLALWSAEVLHTVRLHETSFRTACPDPPDLFDALWNGQAHDGGRRSVFVLFDPLEGKRSDRRRWIGLAEALERRTRARYHDYADALAALRDAGRV